MNSVENLNVSKEKILSTIRVRGPSLPVQIAKTIEFSPLFTSAFLSELKAEGKILISNMRVGSSPLYFLPGQEALLEKFSPYLNQREREAFQLLREKKVLEDSGQEPVVRVALRAIKDFAFPVRIRVGGDVKLYWRYFSLSDNDVADFVGKDERTEIKKEEKEIKEPAEKKEFVEEIKDEPKENLVEKTEVKKDLQSSLEEERPLAEKRQAKTKESEFGINVKDYLQAKDIEVLEVLTEKKKEIEAKVRLDAPFGKQSFYLIAKDKSSTTDNDLAMAFQKAQNERMPALVMSTGELNKKGKTHLEQWRDLVKFEKLRF